MKQGGSCAFLDRALEVAELTARGAQSAKKLATVAAERDALEKQSRELKAELAERSQAAGRALTLREKTCLSSCG